MCVCVPVGRGEGVGEYKPSQFQGFILPYTRGL